MSHDLIQPVTQTKLDQPPKATSLRKRIAFRLGAVFFGLLPLLIFEIVLVSIGWQPSSGVADPYVGFSEIRPLFVKNKAETKFEIAPNRKPLFQPDSFGVHKGDNEFRIFCVGGSTVQGRPFSIETAFPKWLELSLQATDPSRDWRVVNCGGVSYASYRLAPIVDEILEYEPDLIVLYTGQNEFLEDREYAPVHQTAPWVAGTHERLSASRTYSFLRQQFVSADSPALDAKLMPVDAEARLDFQGGLEKYKQDDVWKQGVVTHFRHNLQRMISAAQSKNVPVILMNPVCNLRDVAPFKSVTELNLSEFALLELPVSQRIVKLESLLPENSRNAELHFQLGQSYLLAGKIDLAKTHLLAAKEEDICPLRATEPIYDAIAAVQQNAAVPLVDVRAFFEAKAPNRLPGIESLVDHVHPTIHGHQQIAGLLVEEMQRQSLLTGTTDEPKQAALYERHLESLDFMYFQRAEARLAGLQRWAQGKVTHERSEEEKQQRQDVSD